MRTLDLLPYPAFFLRNTLAPVELALSRATPAALLQWRLGGSVATGLVHRAAGGLFLPPTAGSGNSQGLFPQLVPTRRMISWAFEIRGKLLLGWKLRWFKARWQSF